MAQAALWLFIGFVIGTSFGVVLAGMMSAGKASDESEHQIKRAPRRYIHLVKS